MITTEGCTMRVRMEFENSAGGLTVVEKEMPEDYLGLRELEQVHEVYKEFLQACTFYVPNESHIEIVEGSVY